MILLNQINYSIVSYLNSSFKNQQISDFIFSRQKQFYYQMRNPNKITNDKYFRPFSSTKKSSAFTQTKASFFSSDRAISSCRTRFVNAENSQLSQGTFKDSFANAQYTKKLQKQKPPVMIYFNDKLRKQYNEAIVDSYFLQDVNKNEEQCQSPVFNRSKARSYKNASFHLSDLIKKGEGRFIRTSEQKKRNNAYLSSVLVASRTSDIVWNNKNKVIQKQQEYFATQGDKNIATVCNNNNISSHINQKDCNTLPIINQQVPSPKRPISQQRRTRKAHAFSISSNVKANSHNLQFETSSNGQISQFSGRSQTQQAFQEQKNPQTNLDNIRIVIKKQYDNQYFEILKMVGIENSESKLKRFKQKGKQIYNRQTKIQKLNQIPFLWKQNEKISSIKSNFNKKSLREQIYKMVQEKRNQQDIFNIFPKSQYCRLFLNKNELLIDVIVSICKQLMKVQGKVVHSKININNIYRIRQKQVMIDDWGYSGVKQTLKILDRQWTSVQEPLLGDQKDWLVIPEYMPPQMITDYESGWQNQQIWQTASGTNMWFVGCLIFQIITLTPLWIPYRCLIKGQKQLKKGILSVKRRIPSQIARKHKSFVSKAVKIVQKQSIGSKYGINPFLIQVLQGCLKINPKERITPQNAIKILRI